MHTSAGHCFNEKPETLTVTFNNTFCLVLNTFNIVLLAQMVTCQGTLSKEKSLKMYLKCFSSLSLEQYPLS